MFGPPEFKLVLYLFTKWYGLVLNVVGDYIWKKAKEANEVKKSKRYERCKTARTKKNIQLKQNGAHKFKFIFQQYKQLNISKH